MALIPLTGTPIIPFKPREKKSWEGTYVATAYGPPWDGPNGMEGSGITSRGTRLSPTVQRTMRGPYIIAVDPTVIPYGTRAYIWPNPFNYRGTFLADDTGGAFRGGVRKVDFYDPLGRAHQNAWGVKDVKVSSRPIGGSPWDLGNTAIGGAVEDGVDAVKGPIDDVGKAVGAFVDTITSASFWVRAGKVLIGLIMVIIALTRLTGV